MKRVRSLPGGTLEHAVLVALWSLGRASVREIYTHTGEPEGLVYTTIATVLDRLHAKGLVARKRIGRSFVYEPKTKQEAVERARAARMLRQLLSGCVPRGGEPNATRRLSVKHVHRPEPNERCLLSCV